MKTMLTAILIGMLCLKAGAQNVLPSTNSSIIPSPALISRESDNIAASQMNLSPKAGEEYQVYLKRLSDERKKDPFLFLGASRKEILNRIKIGENSTKIRMVLLSSTDFNEAFLGCIVAVDEGIPIPDKNLHNFGRWYALLRFENEDERMLMNALFTTLVGFDSDNKKKFGIPSNN